MGEAVKMFSVLGQIDRVNVERAAPHYTLISDDKQDVAIAREEGGRLVLLAGPYTFAQIDQHAQLVLAGNHRALTSPEGLVALALGFATIKLLFSRDLPAADETSGAADHAPESPAPEPAPPACDCTPHARAVPPTQESLFACTPCGR